MSYRFGRTVLYLIYIFSKVSDGENGHKMCFRSRGQIRNNKMKLS